jgi:hypothetical protein
MSQPKEEGGKIDLFKKRHNGLLVPSGQPGTARLLVGRAWAGGAAHGPARPGTKCLSGRASPMAAGPCPTVHGPGRAGRALWPSIAGATYDCLRVRANKEEIRP